MTKLPDITDWRSGWRAAGSLEESFRQWSRWLPWMDFGFNRSRTDSNSHVCKAGQHPDYKRREERRHFGGKVKRPGTAQNVRNDVLEIMDYDGQHQERSCDVPNSCPEKVRMISHHVCA